jgi:predicted ATPase
MGEPKEPFVRRVVLRNYKSIKQCDVALGRLAFLVGPNGSGKSNFLEALRFLSDSLQTNIKEAIKQRGELRKIFWREKNRATHFSIRLELTLPGAGNASYEITIGDHEGLFVLGSERCVVRAPGTRDEAKFCVESGEVKQSTIATPPAAAWDQLYLTNVSGYPEFGPVYRLLRGMRFYNIDPQQMRREASSGKPARELERNGDGSLFTAHRLFHNDRIKARIHEYFRAVLPTLDEVRLHTTKTDIGSLHGTYWGAGGEGGVRDPLAGEPVCLKFRLFTGNAHAVFDPQNISDGTLRAFGVLLALFQCADRPANDPIPLVGIEEPESTLHPAAAGVLFDALREASHFTQVLVTTHSPDLLDIPDLDVDSLLIVDMVEGKTIIGPADDVSRSIMRDRLSTAGELLRQNHLRPREESSGTVRAENR